MDQIFTHDLGGAAICWRQTICGSIPLDTWHAHIAEPVRSVEFAYVSMDIHGSWFASIYPAGYDARPQFYVRYSGPGKAISQIERWARANWQRVPIMADRPGWTGKPRG